MKEDGVGGEGGAKGGLYHIYIGTKSSHFVFTEVHTQTATVYLLGRDNNFIPSVALLVYP